MNKCLMVIFGFFMIPAVLSCSESLDYLTIQIEDEERSYYISTIDCKEKKINFLIFFHGLESDGKISSKTLDSFVQMNRKAQEKGIGVVFPIGTVSATGGHKGNLAWEFEMYANNKKFISRLVDLIRKKYNIDSIAVGGYSNGSFFCSKLLEDNELLAFSGYWLQAGGNQISQLKKNKEKIVLEIGKNDHYHYAGMSLLKNFLLSCGWIIDKDLIYREYDGGHFFTLEYFNQNLDFLFSTKNPQAVQSCSD